MSDANTADTPVTAGPVRSIEAGLAEVTKRAKAYEAEATTFLVGLHAAMASAIFPDPGNPNDCKRLPGGFLISRRAILAERADKSDLLETLAASIAGVPADNISKTHGQAQGHPIVIDGKVGCTNCAMKLLDKCLDEKLLHQWALHFAQVESDLLGLAGVVGDTGKYLTERYRKFRGGN